MRPATNSLRAPNPDATLRHPGAYSVVARFTDTLTADVNLFSIFIHGAFQERTNGNGGVYVFNDQTPGDGKNELRFDWRGMSAGQHLIEVDYTGDGLALEATRLVRVTLTGVADTDGDKRLIFERRVHIQGCLLQPRGDQETQLGQKIFENLLARFCERIGPAPSDFLQLAGESCRVIGHCANALAEVPGGLSRIPDRQRGLKFCKRTP